MGPPFPTRDQLMMAQKLNSQNTLLTSMFLYSKMYILVNTKCTPRSMDHYGINFPADKRVKFSKGPDLKTSVVLLHIEVSKICKSDRNCNQH